MILPMPFKLPVRTKGRLTMSKYRVFFYDNNSDETRSITVEAANEDEAEDKAVDRVGEENWPSSFRVADAEEVD